MKGQIFISFVILDP